MRNKLIFSSGVIVGYVLGARAGRERYDQIVDLARSLGEKTGLTHGDESMSERSEPLDVAHLPPTAAGGDAPSLIG